VTGGQEIQALSVDGEEKEVKLLRCTTKRWRLLVENPVSTLGIPKSSGGLMRIEG